MVYNNEVLFIHLGKTGGMSVTNYLCNVLKPPVIHVITEEVPSDAKQAGHEIHHAWKRHANLVEASSYFEKIGMQLSDFKLIFLVVRNPLDLDYSYYKHLRTKRYSKTLFVNDKNRLLHEASNSDYETFALHDFTHYQGNLKDFFEIKGSVPKNMKIVKFEEIAEIIPELIKPYAIKQIPFPHKNKSDSIKKLKPELSLAAFNSIFKKYNYLFNNLYPSIDSPFALDQSQEPEVSDKKYLFISGNDHSGISRINSVIGSHSKIINGVNRYDKLMDIGSFSLSTNHFTKNRFLDIQKGDTVYTDSGRPKRFNRILVKWEQSELIGINIKHSSHAFDYLKKNFECFHYLYVYRDIFSVVRSHKTTVGSEGRAWTQEDLIKTVKQWNESLMATLDLMQSREDVICVKYEDFIEHGKSISPIFDRFNLLVDSNFVLALNNFRMKSLDRNTKLTKLSAKENEYITSNSKLDILDTFNEKYNTLKSKTELEKQPKLILHIGTEKTGSTSIQEFLHLNRKKLQKQGVAYLKSIGYKNHKHLAMAYVSEDKAIEPIDGHHLDLPQQRKAWKEKLLNSFKEEVNSLGEHINKVVISSEHFSSILESVEEIEALNDLFSNHFSSISIIVYLRRQDLIAVSRRSTAYLAGYSSKQSDFEELEPIPFYNYYNLLNNWEKAMPGALIIPRVFEESELIDNSLISDFAMSSGIELTTDFIQPKVLNVSLTKSAMDAALFFDFMVEKGIVGTKDDSIKEFRLQMLEKINQKHPGPSKKPSQVVAKKFLVQYKSINHKIAQKWFVKSKLFSDDFSMYPESSDNSSINIEIVKDVIMMLTEKSNIGNDIRQKMRPILAKEGVLSWLKRFVGKSDNDEVV